MGERCSFPVLQTCFFLLSEKTEISLVGDGTKCCPSMNGP